MEKKHHVDFIIEQFNPTNNAWQEWSRYDLIDSAYINYSKLTDIYPETFYRLIKRTFLVSKETIESSETIEVEYWIQRKNQDSSEWARYSACIYKDLNKAKEIIEFFRKNSNNEEFRLLKKTYATSIEPA